MLTTTTEREAAITRQADALGFRLTADDEYYWLAWRHLCQPCPTLKAVADALESGSAWRRLVARVQGETG